VNVGDLARWNGVDLNNPTIRKGRKLAYRPGSEPSQTDTMLRPPQARTQPQPASMVAYRVKAGDNISTLAWLFGVPEEELLKWNGLQHSSRIRAGDTVRIPVPASPDSGAPQKPAMRVVYYRIKPGDTLWDIAKQFDISVDRLRRLNGLDDQSPIVPGDSLRLLTTDGP